MPLRETMTTTGAVRGVPCGNPLYTVYKGIPYAATTGGDNRFRPPQPAEPWEGIRECDTFSEICMQKGGPLGMPFADFFRKEFYPVQMPAGDDCLKLNVWTPAQSRDEKLPVMFWIHGGGLGSGYGHEMEFDGEAFCKEGVILVTINYRVNYFGFFAHPELSEENEEHVSGNYGMLDQIAAMKWVQENIRNFGGDPDNVTIFGQSAGGGSVIAHLCTEATDGLFHKAIVQSGSFGILSYALTNTLADAENWGKRACEELGKTVEDLRKMTPDELYDTMDAVSSKIGPVPRQSIDGVLYKESPGMALLNGHLKNVPIMTGAVSGDTKLHMPAAFERLNEIPEGDLLVAGDGAIALRRQKEGQIPSYVFYFDPYIPGGDEFGFIDPGETYHSAELWYVFGTLDRCWRPFDGRHHDLSQKVIRYWTNFAKTGDPNGEGLPTWEPVTDRSKKRLFLSEEEIRQEEIPYIDILEKGFFGGE